MSFLLDTNVLSELRKGRRCDPLVMRWAGAAEAELHTSVLAIGEIKRGIERIRPQRPEFAADLERWLNRLITTMGSRILPVDQAACLEWGRISARRTVPPLDGLFAATAAVRGFVLVTRNVGEIADLGVSYFNPFTPPK